MNAQQFRESLHLGFGRALIYARDHDIREYRDVILDACLHCYSYDVQIEGTRADYMYELVALLPDKAFYHDAVLDALAASGDDNDAVQRFRFAARVAMDGDEHAKRMMRADARQACLVEGRSNLLRRLLRQCGSLHLLETRLADARKRRIQIFLHLLAHRIELNAQWQPQRQTISQPRELHR